MLLEQLTEVSAAPALVIDADTGQFRGPRYKTVTENVADAGSDLINLFADVENYLMGIGDDVTKKVLKNYFAFRRIKNFACVEVKTSLDLVRIYLKIDPDSIDRVNGFTRDVRNVGHYGTGDLEVTLRSHDDLERAKPLIQQSYEAS